WIMARRGKPGVSFIDTRTDSEYLGLGARYGLPNNGHIAGARQLQWEELFRDPANSAFRDLTELRKLYADRVQPGDTVVTYCYVGYRASLTYLAARALGLPATLYAGSRQQRFRRV